MKVGNDRQNALRLKRFPFAVIFEESDRFAQLSPNTLGLRIAFRESGPKPIVQGDDPPAPIRPAVCDSQAIVGRMKEA